MKQIGMPPPRWYATEMGEWPADSLILDPALAHTPGHYRADLHAETLQHYFRPLVGVGQTYLSGLLLSDAAGRAHHDPIMRYTRGVSVARDDARLTLHKVVVDRVRCSIKAPKFPGESLRDWLRRPVAGESEALAHATTPHLRRSRFVVQNGWLIEWGPPRQLPPDSSKNLIDQYEELQPALKRKLAHACWMWDVEDEAESDPPGTCKCHAIQRLYESGQRGPANEWDLFRRGGDHTFRWTTKPAGAPESVATHGFEPAYPM